MKFSFLISFFFFLPLFVFNAFGNEPSEIYLEKEIITPKVDKGDWEAVTEGVDYGVIKKKEIKKANNKKNLEGLEFLATLFKVIGVLSVVVAIVFLLRYFVGLQGVQSAKNKAFNPNEKIDTQTVAEHIHAYDLNGLIQQAIAQKEYPTAIRLYYLLSIKTLADNQFIKWKKDKTNRNYLNELVEVRTKKHFKELTNIFERIWYGEVAINENIFKNIEQEFQLFIGSMNKKTG